MRKPKDSDAIKALIQQVRDNGYNTKDEYEIYGNIDLFLDVIDKNDYVDVTTHSDIMKHYIRRDKLKN